MTDDIEKIPTSALGRCQCGLPMINPIWCTGGHSYQHELRSLLRCGICYCTVEIQHVGKHDAWHRELGHV